jgi:hypothetical protein
MRENQFSSFLRPIATGVNQLDLSTGNTVIRTEAVQVRSLHTALQHLDPSIASGSVYLKLDTQGYDLPILWSAGSALQRVLALQTELAACRSTKRSPVSPTPLPNSRL